MEYLDKPALDNTPKAHPAYWRGKAAGISETLKIVSDIMMGKDNGSGYNNNKDIELMRQSLLVWRDELDKITQSKK
jgi:hypothetical protein